MAAEPTITNKGTIRGAHRLLNVVDVFSLWISYLEVGDIVMVSATCQLAYRSCSAKNKGIWIPLVSRLMLDTVGPKQLLGKPDDTVASVSAAADALSRRTASSSPTLAVSSPTALDTHETLRYLFVESDTLASIFLTVLHRVVAQCAHQFNSHGELAEGSWPKILAQKLSLCGFETFSYQVRIIRLVATALTATTTNNSPSIAPTPPSATAPNVVTRQIFRVIERLLLILTHYQSMRSTEVGDHEGVQEIVAAVGNSMEEAIEHLKPLFKSVSKQRMHARPMSRMVLEIKRQCLSVSNSVAVASHLAEINDHPNGQAKYDSLWAVYRATATAAHQSTGAGPPAHFFMPSGDCSTAAPAPSSQQNRNRTSSPLDASTLLMIPLEDGKYSSCLSEAQIHRLRSIRFVRVADILEYFLRMPKSEQEHFRSNVISLYRLTTASMEGPDGVPGGGNQ